jgi:hypothetical protein
MNFYLLKIKKILTKKVFKFKWSYIEFFYLLKKKYDFNEKSYQIKNSTPQDLNLIIL